ncbi:hypothetical protein lerEdw1_018546 [Lerista edwardsae]|nr:hypothetical protein lerEdw1_018546 [Lerista edwardsae]
MPEGQAGKPSWQGEGRASIAQEAFPLPYLSPGERLRLPRRGSLYDDKVSPEVGGFPAASAERARGEVSGASPKASGPWHWLLRRLWRNRPWVCPSDSEASFPSLTGLSDNTVGSGGIVAEYGSLAVRTSSGGAHYRPAHPDHSLSVLWNVKRVGEMPTWESSLNMETLPRVLTFCWLGEDLHPGSGSIQRNQDKTEAVGDMIPPAIRIIWLRKEEGPSFFPQGSMCHVNT